MRLGNGIIVDMKMGIDASSLSSQRTGIGNYVYNLLLALVKLHPEVQFYLYGYKDLTFPEYENVKSVGFPLRVKGPFFNNLIVPFLIFFHGIDVFWGASGFVPIWKLKKYKSIVIVYDHVYRRFGSTMSKLGYWSRRIFQPLSNKLADHIVAISKFTASEIVEKPQSKITVIYPTINSLFQGAIKKSKLSESITEPYILVLGTIEPRKNIQTLIKAYKNLIENQVHLPKLVIVGKVGWRASEIQSEIQSLERGGHLYQAGFVPDDKLPILYKNCYCFLMPSLYEGFGMPLIEAQLCNAPVAASNLPVFEEATGGVAVFFEPTYEGLKEFLLKLSNKELPFVCRMPSDIQNNADDHANQFWKVVEWINPVVPRD